MYTVLLGDNVTWYITDDNYKIYWRNHENTTYQIEDIIKPSPSSIYQYRRSTEEELDLLDDEVVLELL